MAEATVLPPRGLKLSTNGSVDLIDSSTFSALAATSVMNAVIDKGADQLYEKYLSSKEQEFVILRTVQSLQHLIEWQLPVVDASEHRGPDFNSLPSASASGLWECEPEPQPAPLDSWVRSAVPTKLPLMRRREVLQARRAASLQDQRQRVEEEARHAIEAAAVVHQHQISLAVEQQARAGRPGTVNSGPGTVGSQLPTIAEGKEEGGEGSGARASTVAQNAKQSLLADLDAKAKKAQQEEVKADKLAKDAAARDKAMRKALDGRPYTLDERGGIIVVDALGDLPSHTRAAAAGVAGSWDDGGEGTARRKPRSSGNLSGAPSPGLLDPLARADAAERVKEDPRYRMGPISTQPSLVDALVGGDVQGQGLSTASVGSVSRGLSAGVSVRETGRTLVGAASGGTEISRKGLEARRAEMGGLEASESIASAGSFDFGLHSHGHSQAQEFGLSSVDQLTRDNEWDTELSGSAGTPAGTGAFKRVSAQPVSAGAVTVRSGLNLSGTGSRNNPSGPMLPSPLGSPSSPLGQAHPGFAPGTAPAPAWSQPAAGRPAGSAQARR